MAFNQRIYPAGHDTCAAMGHDPAGCTVIDCVTGTDVTHHETGEVIHPAGAVVWVSHLNADIHAEHRLNGTHPAEDHRGHEPRTVQATPWCETCRDHPAVKGLADG